MHPAHPVILAFGNFDLEGGRSWAIRTGLTEQGWTVELCRTDADGAIGKWRHLRRQWKALTVKPDAVYVPFLGHWVLPMAWWLTRLKRIPVVFDAFLSLYDTEVHDRKRLRPWHPKAWFLWWTDWLCCRLCDRVLLDTEEHAEYFAKTFGVQRDKILVLPIGCRTDIFTPATNGMVRSSDHDHRAAVSRSSLKGDASAAFSVEFHGTFIPLQGIDVILRAAALIQKQAPDIRFTIIGKGQTFSAMLKLAGQLSLTNTDFPGMKPMEDVATEIRRADVCLGIFGTTEKAQRVIPNKAYEILNTGRPLITARTPASLRVFRDEVEVLLVPPGDPEALAAAILRLRNEPELRETIAENSLRLSLERFQPKRIVEPIVTFLKIFN